MSLYIWAHPTLAVYSAETDHRSGDLARLVKRVGALALSEGLSVSCWARELEPPPWLTIHFLSEPAEDEPFVIPLSGQEPDLGARLLERFAAASAVESPDLDELRWAISSSLTALRQAASSRLVRVPGRLNKLKVSGLRREIYIQALQSLKNLLDKRPGSRARLAPVALSAGFLVEASVVELAMEEGLEELAEAVEVVAQLLEDNAMGEDGPAFASRLLERLLDPMLPPDLGHMAARIEEVASGLGPVYLPEALVGFSGQVPLRLLPGLPESWSEPLRFLTADGSWWAVCREARFAPFIQLFGRGLL